MADDVDKGRRKILIAAAGVMGGAGAVMVARPFVESMQPSARAEAAGAPVEVNIEKLAPGQLMTVAWRGKPVWILRRTEEMLKNLTAREHALKDAHSAVGSQQPQYAQNPYRAARPEYLVVVGICTHLGCSPSFRPDLAPADLGPEWQGGFFCPCHGSRFDFAGRVFNGVPAPTNLVVPPYRYLSDTRLLIGVNPESA